STESNLARWTRIWRGQERLGQMTLRVRAVLRRAARAGSMSRVSLRLMRTGNPIRKT
ncbi:hypothetical protein H0H92_013259, partial [Tricholoma furcatifolium]